MLILSKKMANLSIWSRPFRKSKTLLALEDKKFKASIYCSIKRLYDGWI